jgi:predicted MFS family arabinose efflux permease
LSHCVGSYASVINPYFTAGVFNNPAIGGVTTKTPTVKPHPTRQGGGHAIGSVFGGVLVDWLRSSRNALLTVSIVLLALIYPTMYWILIGGNGWAVLLWDFLAVLPVGMTPSSP